MSLLCSLTFAAQAEAERLDKQFGKDLPERTLTFPKFPHGRFGDLLHFSKMTDPVEGYVDYFYYIYANNDLVCKADGTVHVPAHVPVCLAIGMDGSYRLDVLDQFHPNDVQAVTIDYPAPEEISLQSLSRLTGLLELSINNCEPKEMDLAPLKPLKSLHSLKLEQINLDDRCLKTICTMTELRQLSLARTTLSGKDVSPLLSLKNLEALLLTSIPIKSSQLPTISQMPLRLLDLRRTKVDDTGWENLLKMRHLSILKLTMTDVGDHGVEVISKLPLVHLDLKQTKITNRCVPALCKMKTLKLLVLDNTPLSDLAISKIRKSLPNTTVRHIQADSAREYHELFHDKVHR